ncbi:hypothetical protein Tco_0325054 [Tanacetum coccineum]
MYSGINMVGLAKNLRVFIGNHQFLVDFIILENISEFVEKGLTEVLFGQPFKEQIGLIEDRGKGTLWFKIGNDKTVSHMPRAEKAFRKLTIKQHNSMGPLLKVSDEDKKKGIHKPEKRLRDFTEVFLVWETSKNMIRKLIQKLGGNYRDRLDSYSFGNLAEFAAGIKSLLEDGDIDFRPISNFKAMLREFLITAEVLEIYTHQFWNTINKIGNINAYNFKLDKKKYRVNTEVFYEILHIFPRLPNQDFDDLPSEDDLVSFIKELGYSGNCEMLSTIRNDQMHQPWRTLTIVINRCISGKSTGLDRLKESRAQLLWAMYNLKNVDYVALL